MPVEEVQLWHHLAEKWRRDLENRVNKDCSLASSCARANKQRAQFALSPRGKDRSGVHRKLPSHKPVPVNHSVTFQNAGSGSGPGPDSAPISFSCETEEPAKRGPGRAVTHFVGLPLTRYTDPGAYAPGFMLTPASQVYAPGFMLTPASQVYAPGFMRTPASQVYAPGFMRTPASQVYGQGFMFTPNSQVYGQALCSRLTRRFTGQALCSRLTRRFTGKALCSRLTRRFTGQALCSHLLRRFTGKALCSA
jgi:hypothetical protein